ncbi:Ig-like domain-containing protein [Enterobacter hormaechei]
MAAIKLLLRLKSLSLSLLLLASLSIRAPPSVEANKTVQLTANIEPAGATNKRVTWASKNAEFATVDSATGLVTGVAAGTATIEVTTEDGSHKATATVEVTAAPAA